MYGTRVKTCEDVDNYFKGFETAQFLIENVKKYMADNPQRSIRISAGAAACGFPTGIVIIYDCETDEQLARFEDDDYL